MVLRKLLLVQLTYQFVYFDFKENSWNVQSNIVLDEINSINSGQNFDATKKLVSIDDLHLEEKMRAEKVVDSFKEICSKNKLGRTNKICLNIDTADAKPFHERPYPMSPYMQEVLNKVLDEMLKLGVI